MKLKTKEEFDKLSDEGGDNFIFIIYRGGICPDYWNWDAIFSRFLGELNEWEDYKGNPLPFDIWFYKIETKEKKTVGWFKKREIEIIKPKYYGVLVFREKLSDRVREILNAVAFGITCRFFGR